MIEKIITKECIFYRYDIYETGRKSIISSSFDDDVFLFNSTDFDDVRIVVDNVELNIDGVIDLQIGDSFRLPTSDDFSDYIDYKILSIEQIPSFIDLYRSYYSDDEDTEYELVHLYSHSVSTYDDKDEWLSFFNSFKNNVFQLSPDVAPICPSFPITLYRGYDIKEDGTNTKDGISWTYDKKIALCFGNELVEVSTTLDKVSYILDGHEKEVIFKNI